MRCEEPCGKVIYTSEMKAQLAAVRVAMGGDGTPMSWYRSTACGNGKGCWHLTKKMGKRAQWVKGFADGNGRQEQGCGQDRAKDRSGCAAA